MLRSQVLDNEEAPDTSHSRQQIQEIPDLLELFTIWFDDVQKMQPDHSRSLMKMGSSIGKVLHIQDRLIGKVTNKVE